MFSADYFYPFGLLPLNMFGVLCNFHFGVKYKIRARPLPNLTQKKTFRVFSSLDLWLKRKEDNKSRSLPFREENGLRGHCPILLRWALYPPDNIMYQNGFASSSLRRKESPEHRTLLYFSFFLFPKWKDASHHPREFILFSLGRFGCTAPKPTLPKAQSRAQRD